MSLRFRRLAVTLVVIVAAVGATGVSIAATAATTPRAAPSAALGQKLVARFWRELARHDRAALGKLLSPAFYYEVANGLREDKGQYLGHLPKVVRYHLRDFKIGVARAAITATYLVSGKEVIGGKDYEFHNIGRMSVFGHYGPRWMLLAHANFGAR